MLSYIKNFFLNISFYHAENEKNYYINEQNTWLKSLDRKCENMKETDADGLLQANVL